jgi:hypothetical protein
MRCEVAILGFFIIVLILIAGCSSQAPSRTSSSAPSISTTSPVSSVQSESHDINSIQTFSKDGTSIVVSIDRITSTPGPNYNYFSWLTVNYTFTNTGTDALRIQPVGGGIITDYPHKLKQCSDARTCNTTYFSIYFVKHSLNSDGSVREDGSDILYPGIPQKVTSNTSFDENDYETLKQGMSISFNGVCIDSLLRNNMRCYEGWNKALPSWKIDFAKDVTILPAK